MKMKKKDLIEILVNDYHEDENEMKKMKRNNLEELLDEYSDTSSFHPNETFEEFMEHESYD